MKPEFVDSLYSHWNSEYKILFHSPKLLYFNILFFFPRPPGVSSLGRNLFGGARRYHYYQGFIFPFLRIVMRK